MNFGEMVTTIKAQLHERVSSPLLATFTISWCVINYKFFLIVVSSAPIEERLKLIDQIAFPLGAETLVRVVAYPLIASAFLLFLYPYPAKWVYGYWHKKQRDMKKIQQEIDDEMPLTREEAKEIRTKATLLQIEYEKQLDARDDQIRRLKEAIGQLQIKEVTSPERTNKKGEAAAHLSIGYR